MDADALQRAYLTLNRGYKRKLIFQLTGRGFASEISIMLSIMLYCLVNEMEFILFSRSWNGRVRRGWRDYFKPFCRETGNLFFYRKTVLGMTSFERLLQRIHGRILPNTPMTHDVLKLIQNESFLNRKFTIPELGIDGDIFQAKQVLLSIVYRFNRPVESCIAKQGEYMRGKLPYAGIHVRRGDKVAEASREADCFSAEAYLERVSDAAPHCSNIFVATDDYAVVEEFNAVSTSKMHITSGCPQQRTGHEQRRFNKQKGSARRKDMIALLVDIHYLVEAEIFVGTFSSNIGRLVSLLRNGKKCFSLDEEWHGA